jgi:hypothetical protein
MAVTLMGVALLGGDDHLFKSLCRRASGCRGGAGLRSSLIRPSGACEHRSANYRHPKRSPQAARDARHHT